MANASDNCPDTANASQLNTDSPADTYGDACDSDDDNDGYADGSDNCPLVSNASQANLDGDAYGDACDDDRDGDGVTNASDNCPDTANASQLNTDSPADTYGDACDSDDDNDGYADGSDNCPLVSNASQANLDSDAYGDACDDDRDGDGDPDASDCDDTDDEIYTGAAESCDSIDSDCDGSLVDGFTNTDGDAYPDCVDADDDGDGYSDAYDNCPLVANPTQSDFDRDGQGDACESDSDGDGYDDSADNCIFVANADQSNVDGDAYGDACDSDDDGDGDPDAYDCDDTDAGVYSGAPESCDAIDSNCNGSLVDTFTNTDGDAYPDCIDADDDGDGYSDAYDNCPLVLNPSQLNTDGTSDGGDDCDSDDDNDGTADAYDAFPKDPTEDNDLDGDGIGDNADADDDNDGDQDTYDNCPDIYNPDQLNCDGDSYGNACDADDDNDLLLDAYDNCPLVQNITQADTDGDGVGNACEAPGDSNADGLTDSMQPDVATVAENCNEPFLVIDARSRRDDDDTFAAVNAPSPDNGNGALQAGVVLRDVRGGQLSQTGSASIVAAAGSAYTIAAAAPTVGFQLELAVEELSSVPAGLRSAFEAQAQAAFSSVPQRIDILLPVEGLFNAYFKLHPDTGAAELFGWDPVSETGAVFVDRDGNGLVDAISLYIRDGQRGDFDNVANARIIDPGVAVSLDGYDADSDGFPDTTDNCPSVPNSGQSDTDLDGYGDDCDSDDDADGYLDGADCAPLDATRNPGATEVCDGYDNNCISGIDEYSSGVPYYVDADNDGYGTGSSVGSACSEDAARALYGPGSYAPLVVDCQDNDGTIYPGAVETCANIGIDNDCSQGGEGTDKTAVDMLRYYQDNDGDGYGMGPGLLACSMPWGYAANGGDCNDTPGAGASIHPSAFEACDGINNDCDAYADEGFPNFDGDSYADCVDSDTDNDGWLNAADCDDYASDTYPGAAENCANAGVNNDCNSANDAEAYASDGQDYWRDFDKDGFGDSAVSGRYCSVASARAAMCAPSDPPVAGCDGCGACNAVLAGGAEDCNDSNGAAYPGATESCDGADNDCDTYADEGFPNFDGDSYADCADSDDDNDGYSGGTGAGQDCNDLNASIRPGAPETCDDYGIDNDCDGDRYEAVASNWHADADGDSYGNPALHVVACTQPSGYVANSSDCNDAYSYAWTASSGEICDGYDNNCNSQTDEGVKTRFYRDGDGDTYTGDTYQDACSAPSIPGGGGPWGTTDEGDCNDANAAIYPGAVENCANLGVNNDCDAYNDAAEAIDSANYYTDSDNDNYGTGAAFKACSDTSSSAPRDGDCNDLNPAVNPGAAEVCDGANNDCDAYTDEGFPNFDGDGYADCVDGDIDNDGSLNAPDCDDYAADIYPGAAEVCANINIDNDCDGNDLEATDLSVWNRDADNDGYGTDSATGRIKACTGPQGYRPNTDDCNDADRYTYLNAPELCDTYGTDNDCDGDRYDATNPSTWYADADNDSYGNPSSAVSACNSPNGYVGNGGDCNDSASYAWTGRAEICDGYDNNCVYGVDEGVTTTFYRDVDGDGFGKATSGTMQRCSAGDGYVSSSTDCNDGDRYTNPSATEVTANTNDDNCDGYELCYNDGDDDGFLDGYGGTRSSSNTSCNDANESPTNFPTGDCNDAAANVYPGAPENCDTINVDNDCDGNSTEAENAQRYYRDADGDSYGSGDVYQMSCIHPAGWGLTNTDCDDADRYTNPGAVEVVANGKDNDCDGYEACFVDADNDKFLPSSPVSAETSADLDCDDAYEGGNSMPRTDACPEVFALQSTVTYYVDSEADGRGCAAAQLCEVSAPAGYATVAGDNCCDAYNPDQANCDVDAYGNACDSDDDNDGYSDTAEQADCTDPTVSATATCNAAVYPGAPEVCATIGVDNDCDEHDNDASDFQALYVDYDGDGYGDRTQPAVKSCAGPNMSSNNLDCNDQDAAISPSATEVCDSGVDNDCDNYADDADSQASSIPNRTRWYGDVYDNDTYGDSAVFLDRCVQPSGYVANNTDQCPTVAGAAPATWYRDQDIDGYGGTATTSSCTNPTTPPAYWRTAGGDCNDLDQYAYPNAPELCATLGVDNDCDGDRYDATDKTTFYRDGDGDGYGASTSGTSLRCSAGDGYVGNDSDCNDTYATLWTGIRYYRDSDGDGCGDADSYASSCSLSPPAGYVANANDQCDSDAYKCNAGQCGCGTPDTDSDGDGYADCVDRTPQLSLVAASPIFSDGYVDIYVQLGAAQSDQFSTGAQMQLAYDAAKLTFVHASPGSATAGPGLFSQEVFESVNATAGTITYGVGVADGQTGSRSARRVAVLRFRLAGGTICSESNLVRFATGGSTYLSNQGGTAAIMVTTSNLGPFTAYGTATGLIGVPASSTRPADAGRHGAAIAQPTVTYVPVCGASASSVSVSWTRFAGTHGCDAADSDSAESGTGWPAGSVFKTGRTRVTWSAGTGAGAVSATACYTVEDYQVMTLSVALEGADILPSARTLEVSADAYSTLAPATLGDAAALVTLRVPVAAGYGCVSVKDAAHTLRHSTSPTILGTAYVASLVLKQGDSNNDNAVDILDFGTYVADFGTGRAANARSNFNGDSAVNTTDFSFISFNFFRVGAGGCGGAGDGGLAGDGPSDRVSVAYLRKMGHGELVIADLNRDGWVDTADMALWMQGIRPEHDAGDAGNGDDSTE